MASQSGDGSGVVITAGSVESVSADTETIADASEAVCTRTASAAVARFHPASSDKLSIE